MVLSRKKKMLKNEKLHTNILNKLTPQSINNSPQYMYIEYSVWLLAPVSLRPFTVHPSTGRTVQNFPK